MPFFFTIQRSKTERSQIPISSRRQSVSRAKGTKQGQHDDGYETRTARPAPYTKIEATGKRGEVGGLIEVRTVPVNRELNPGSDLDFFAAQPQRQR
jgi:hypothetical protein